MSHAHHNSNMRRVTIALVLTGTFMYDVVKNLSEFETPNNTTVSLVDSVIKAVGLDKK